ncbi:VOC family protein [Hymenobacter chitinivorans]|uniref:Lactoylglutathione lyase/glyoxylase I family protein n=1 Tax=Hymenobacter chitinivorans DSM 11115 TaxID=1121954 RepID=A0A2M9BSL5_9BACT|nr:VOC family protein [Hymenobacter chitinivorans]PJJ60927.1 lactoylglutathione lyase/glyoxylase I family protein [Hymenobacter chitinivorans DSM 11115]
MNNIQLPPKNPAGGTGRLRAAHVGLRTPDYAATLRWYTQKLGFRILKEWTVGALQLAFLAPANDDRFWLEIIHDPAAGPGSGPPLVAGFQHLCFEVDHLDETLAELRARAVRVIREPFSVPAIGKRCGFVADLHGNVLELAESI